MTAFTDDKAALRAQMRATLKALSAAWLTDSSARICEKLRSASFMQRAPALAAFMPIKQEPAITPILIEWLNQSPHRPLYLPRYDATADQYTLVQIRDLNADCICGKYAIPEPDNALPEVTSVPDGTICLVPGLAFTRNGARLGRGKGYYDRLLAKYPNLIPVGLCWQLQIVPNLPTDQYDVLMTDVVTE